MDLGLTGKWAIVCASSKGLGRGCAEALAGEGVNLVVTARTQSTLNEAAEYIANKWGVTVEAVTGDITTPEGRAEVLKACPNPDILVNNAGGPPPGDYHDWGLDEWNKALNANMLTPIELMKAVIDGMRERKFGRIVNITSAAVKAPIDILGLSNGARAGLTGFVAGLSRKTVIDNVTINALLPGPFDTDRLKSNFEAVASSTGTPIGELRAQRAAANPAGRFGTAEEFGAACAFLCSDKSGFITGQNILLDGGAFPGTL